jgi:hypothetical protein
MTKGIPHGNHKHGWKAVKVMEFLNEVVPGQVAGSIGMLTTPAIDWESGDVPVIPHLDHRIAHAITSFRAVSLVLSEGVSSRDAWYKALDRVRESGVCCLRTVIFADLHDCPAMGSSSLLKIVVLTESEHDRLSKDRKQANVPYTKFVCGVASGHEYATLKGHIRDWMLGWL